MGIQLTKRAKEIIADIAYLTIATVDEKNQPWNAPVFFAFDDDYNLYWGSHINAQHSRNIKRTGKAFLVIYDSTVKAGAGEGVYMLAICKEVTDPVEMKRAHQLLWDRHTVPYWKLEEFEKANAPIRLYKARPEKIWMNDEGQVNGTYIDKRTEVTL